MIVNRSTIYLFLVAGLIAPASVLSYSTGHSFAAREVVTTTATTTSLASVSTFSITKTISSVSTTTQQSNTTSTITATKMIPTTKTTTQITTATTTTTATATTTATKTINNNVTITNTITTTHTITSTTTTAAASVGPFRFVVMGDSRGNSSGIPVNTAVLSNLTDTANGFNPAFALFTGDLCYDFTSNCSTIWKNAVDGSLLAKTIFVRGNHDVGNDTFWRNTFNMSLIIASFGGTNYSYRLGQDGLDYSFDYGNSHFVGLNVVDDVIKVRPSPDQLRWLDMDLSNAERTGCGSHNGCTFTFIFFHAPVYCAARGGHCSSPPIPPTGWTTVTNNHSSVVAVFQAHEHLLSYAHINGSRIQGVNSSREYEEFIIGSAGALPYSCALRADWCSSKYGFATVDVYGSTVTVQVYDINGQPLHTPWIFNKSRSNTTATT